MSDNIITNKKSDYLNLTNKELFEDISNLIEKAKEHVAYEYNSAHLLLNWMIGKRINDEILQSKRAEYGEEIVKSISSELSLKYGNGYSRANIFRMIKFAKLFPDKEIVSTLSRQLSWSHFIIICGVEDHLKREFYIEMCRVQRWSVRSLKTNLDGMLYERTAISKKPEELIKKSIEKLDKFDKMTNGLIFKDPYFIEFIGNKDSFDEKTLEDMILDNITEFLQELGGGFCFIARQKRQVFSI